MSFENWFLELEEIILELLGVKARDMEGDWFTYWEDAYKEEKRPLRVALDTAELWAAFNPEIRERLRSGAFSDRLEELIRERGEGSEEIQTLPPGAWVSLGEDSRTDLGIVFMSHIFTKLEDLGIVQIPEEDREEFFLTVIEGINQAWQMEGLFVGSIAKRKEDGFPIKEGSWSIWDRYTLSQDEKTLFVKLAQVLDRLTFLSEYRLWPIAWDPQIEKAVQVLERRLPFFAPMSPKDHEENLPVSPEERSPEFMREIEAYIEEELENVPAPFQSVINGLRERTIALMDRLLYILNHNKLEIFGDEQIEAAINTLLIGLPGRPEFLNPEEG